MSKSNNIFISWAGERSKHVALGLRDWLPAILQTARPWMSDTDIDKGSRGLDEISKALSETKVGVACLTPENLDSHWILYEAGAVSKTVDVETRLCTLLLGGLEPNQVKQPLGIFQYTRSTKKDIKQLVKTINSAINEEPLADPILDKLFESLWPELEKTLKSMPDVPKAPANRSVEDMISELLDISRADRLVRMDEIQARARQSLHTLEMLREARSELEKREIELQAARQVKERLMSHIEDLSRRLVESHEQAEGKEKLGENLSLS